MKRENRVVDYFIYDASACSARGRRSPALYRPPLLIDDFEDPVRARAMAPNFPRCALFFPPHPLSSPARAPWGRMRTEHEHHGKGGEPSSTLLWTTHLVSGAHKGESASSSPPPLAHRTRHTPRRPVPLLPAQICATRRPSRSGVLLRLRWLPLTASMSLSPSLRHPVQNPTGR